MLASVADLGRDHSRERHSERDEFAAAASARGAKTCGALRNDLVRRNIWRRLIALFAATQIELDRNFVEGEPFAENSEQVAAICRRYAGRIRAKQHHGRRLNANLRGKVDLWLPILIDRRWIRFDSRAKKLVQIGRRHAL